MLRGIVRSNWLYLIIALGFLAPYLATPWSGYGVAGYFYDINSAASVCGFVALGIQAIVWVANIVRRTGRSRVIDA